MDPATLSAIFGVARQGIGGIASNAPYLFENPHEQENAKEAAKLKHLIDSGALGLTADEQQRILSRQQGAAENQLQRTAAQSAQIQAAAVGSGEALKKAVLLGQSGAGIRQDISQGVEDLNQREAQRQREEYAARSAADQEAKDRRLRAWLGILTGTVDAAATTADQNKLLTGSAAKPQAVAATDIAAQYMKDYGLSQEDAEALAAASSEDADLAASASKLLGNTGAE